MSKLTKLKKNPKLFFTDSYHKRKKMATDFLSNKSVLFNKKQYPNKENEDSIEYFSPSTEALDMTFFEKVKASKNVNELLNSIDSSEIKDYKLIKSIADNHLLIQLLKASFQYELYNNGLFSKNNYESDYRQVVSLDDNSEITKSLKDVDNLKITPLISHFVDNKDSYSYKSLFSGMIKILDRYSSTIKNVDVLLGDENISELNANAINPSLIDSYVSNFMFYELNKKDSEDLGKLQNKSELYWWWVTSILPSKNLNSKFIPAEILAFYNETTFTQESLKASLPHFFHEVYKRNSVYQRYNIVTEVGFLGYILDCFLHNFNNPINGAFINNSSFVQNELKKTVYKFYDNQRLTVFDVLFFALSNRNFHLKNVDVNDIYQFCADKYQKLKLINPTLKKLSGIDGRVGNLSTDNKKLTLVGLYSSTTGLGANIRMMSNALLKVNIAHEVYDIATKETIKIDCDNSVHLHRDCNIFMVNADMIPDYVFSVFQGNDVCNIGFLLWELETVPKTHQFAIDFLDEIWVPTNYLKNIYQKYTDTPVKCVGKHIDLIAPTVEYKYNRNGDSKFKFYSSFDFHSNIERKNPVAAVLAFKEAFRNDEPVEFYLKTTDIVRHHPGNHKEQWERILKLTSSDNRFKIVTGRIPFQELVNQINSMECVVSAHRSEGFGYLPAHAFLLDKPVILTDYSGTTDFCNDKTAYPVKWNKLELDKGDFGDVKDGFWADADVNDMAKHMREVYENYDKAKSKAANGKKLIQNQYSLNKFMESCVKSLRKLHILN